MKYSFDFTLKVNAPSIASEVSSILSRFPNLAITPLKVVLAFSLFITENPIESLNAIFFCFLIFLIPEIISEANSNSLINALSIAFVSGSYTACNTAFNPNSS